MTIDCSMYEYFVRGTAHLPRTNKTVSFFGKGKYNFDFCKGTDGEEHEE